MWTYIPGIHTKLICADNTMVSKQTNKKTIKQKIVKARIYKQSYKHTFSTTEKEKKKKTGTTVVMTTCKKGRRNGTVTATASGDRVERERQK